MNSRHNDHRVIQSPRSQVRYLVVKQVRSSLANSLDSAEGIARRLSILSAAFGANDLATVTCSSSVRKAQGPERTTGTSSESGVLRSVIRQINERQPGLLTQGRNRGRLV